MQAKERSISKVNRFHVAKLKAGFILALSIGLTASCMTMESTDFVNYKAIGDVYTTKPQAVDYEEVGNVSGSSSGFLWSSCEKLCREAIEDSKYQSKKHGGDSVIDLGYKDSDGGKTQEPTCVSTWGWVVWTYGFGAVAPWVRNCSVQVVAVSRVKQKNLQQQAQEKQPQGNSVNININNTQNNGEATKPAH